MDGVAGGQHVNKALLPASAPLETKKIPVIVDTDIGDDIDDTWAMCFLLGRPELELRLATTAWGDRKKHEYRAKVLAIFLEAGGVASQVPIGFGVDTGPSNSHKKPYDPDRQLPDDEGKPVRYQGELIEDGVDALINEVMTSETTVTIIAIGPFANIAEAIRREPRVLERARIVAMAGSIHLGYDGIPPAISEYNVRVDVESARAVLTANWKYPIVLAPLDTCGVVHLKGSNYEAFLQAARTKTVPRLMLEHYQAWLKSWGKGPDASETSPLFDAVAAYLSFSQKFLGMEDLELAVDSNGFTVITPGGAPVPTAVRWLDLAAFEALLLDTLQSFPDAAAQ